jgi:hypothetical protein
MTKLSLIAIAVLFASFTAHAADSNAPKAAAPAPIAAPVAAAAPQKTATTAAAPQTGAISQQDKMRLCNKQATGKKGAERKAFMKTCLSKKA